VGRVSEAHPPVNEATVTVGRVSEAHPPVNEATVTVGRVSEAAPAGKRSHRYRRAGKRSRTRR
ncbi:hypothetical protein ACI0X2_004230, partial [Cronobacter turicensis]